MPGLFRLRRELPVPQFILPEIKVLFSLRQKGRKRRKEKRWSSWHIHYCIMSKKTKYLLNGLKIPKFIGYPLRSPRLASSLSCNFFSNNLRNVFKRLFLKIDVLKCNRVQTCLLIFPSKFPFFISPRKRKIAPVLF